MGAAAAAELLQSCPPLCDPIDGSPPGSPVPGILQARTLEWVAISFSNAWEWKVKVKSLSRVRLFATPWTAAYQAPLSMGLIFQARVLEWGAIAFSVNGSKQIIIDEVQAWVDRMRESVPCEWNYATQWCFVGGKVWTVDDCNRPRLFWFLISCYRKMCKTESEGVFSKIICLSQKSKGK